MLIKPHITEKTVAETAKGKYTFVVDKLARKLDIKNAVEKMFGVKCVKIQTAMMHGKVYRTGKRFRFAHKADWKKATVTVASGQKIELFDINPAKAEQK